MFRLLIQHYIFTFLSFCLSKVIKFEIEFENIAKEDLKSTLNFKDVQALIIKQADEMFSLIEDGGEEAAKNLANNFKKGKDWIEWVHDGSSIVTGTASHRPGGESTIGAKYTLKFKKGGKI